MAEVAQSRWKMSSAGVSGVGQVRNSGRAGLVGLEMEQAETRGLQ